MIKGDYDYLANLAKINVCLEHKAPLEVAWYGAEHTWVLRCGHDHYPDSITRQPSLLEEYKAGAVVDEPIKGNMLKAAAKRAHKPGTEPAVKELALFPQADLGTGELLVPELVTALVAYAYKYGLDPYRGHVMMMYGKPYIGIDGYLYHARRSNIAYTLDSRPLGADELKDYRAPENAHVWLAKVRFTDTGQMFVGYGIVTQEEMEATSPRDKTRLRSPVVAAHPWQLCQKRAEWQALRRAFPIGETEEAE